MNFQLNLLKLMATVKLLNSGQFKKLTNDNKD